MKAVEKVDWFCPKCNSYVSSESVTFEETHQICNTGVILEPLNQNKMTAYQEKIKQALISGALLQCTEGKNYKTWLVYPNGNTEIIRRDSAEKVCESCFGSLVFGEPNGIRWYKK